jgi:hypothetical protein
MFIAWDRMIQIVYLFFHVFCMYSVLLRTDFTYSCVPGDQGGPFFFRQEIVLAVVLHTNWCATICITYPILRKIECNEFVCNKFVFVSLQINIMQFVLLLCLVKKLTIAVFFYELKTVLSLCRQPQYIKNTSK